MTSATAGLAEPDTSLLLEPSAALPLVTLNVAFKAGALQDPPGKEGLSRLVARLMRRTAGGMKAETIDEKVDAMGGALGVDVTHSGVSFQGTVISRSLDDFAALLAEVLGAPSLSAEELERLKRESEAELLESRDNDRGLARRWFRRRVFDEHPYCRPASGTMASLRSITRDDVIAHYERCMCAGNSIIALSGDVSATKAQELAARLRTAMRAGAHSAQDPAHPTVPPGLRLVIVDKPERTQTQVLIGGLGTYAHDEDHIALHVANTIFGGTFTARLMHEVRSKRGWSYGAYSSLPYDRRRRAFSMWTFPKAEDAAACIQLELSLLSQWWDAGVTKKELDWAKRYLARSNAFAIDTAAKRAALALDEIMYALPARYHADYVEHVRAVTPEQANEAIRRRISPKDLLIVVVGTAETVQGPIREVLGETVSTEIVSFETDA